MTVIMAPAHTPRWPGGARQSFMECRNYADLQGVAIDLAYAFGPGNPVQIQDTDGWVYETFEVRSSDFAIAR